MISLTINEIAEAVGALNTVDQWSERAVTSVGFDTRKLTAGSLFVPLIGENDGHRFIEQAIEQGAVAAFWSAPLAEAPADFPVIQVADTLAAMQQLAKYYLKKVAPKVVAITGSNGKTTTKDMTEAVLSARYKVHKTQGNFNNHIGLPYTILEMSEDTEVIILEMGMNHPGEIKVLSDLAEPDIAIITMIGESHIEYLGSRAAIADAKMEITSGLKKDGILIYPGAEPLLQERVQGLSSEQLRTFGQEASNDLYPLQVKTEMKETTFTTNSAPDVQLQIPVLGTYNVNNALAALLAGLATGILIKEAAGSLARFHLTKNRTEWLKGYNNSAILNDAYNANPTAMKLVIENFSRLSNNGQKIVVLGDMLELGEWSAALHESIKEVLSPEAIDQVVLYGEKMQVLATALVEENIFDEHQVHHFTGEKEPMIQYLKDTLRSDDYVLIKSSFGTDLLSVVRMLTV
ncbi:UDP-N-acetylmuramoyl-tripeptide--D-alanyl-D-alanine ligase [Pisciglobus halotolerans]|uniref:UDP-N-acetylmuramoyl-tripeptide--D-alanyl-D-alanine ligase n=1 Tax=Pisciglobus halotolerans TaxID=745365 RepID=A0A1I3D6D5_9LACT|nr:UDP-N-acetylmuramoyl-tripeptide--D-alanyl-D-alanine ligase [Pisciglobus halotolerans]SFH82293.1 UDP-N-acetylmuramoyl-tripeptide--D-alanyl-D-alanine ligase [Pisciglobus halotolerans]